MSGALWTKLRYVRGALLVAETEAAPLDPPGTVALHSDANGILQGHAYSVLRVVQIEDRDGVHRLLQLRDPWGASRWRGKWSRYDTRSWSRKLRERLGYTPVESCGVGGGSDGNAELRRGSVEEREPDEDQNEDDGADDGGCFWISFQDFVCSFKMLHVCRLFDPSEWKQKSVEGVWRADGGTKVSLRITAAKPRGRKGRDNVRVFVSITNTTPGLRFYPYMSLLLLAVDADASIRRSRVLSRHVVASTGKYKDVRDLSFETKLPYGDATFTLYPSLFPATAHGSFTINVYCVADFELSVGGRAAAAPSAV
jgi:hypothetical protein